MIKTELQNTPGDSSIPPKRARYGVAFEYASNFYKILIPLCWIVFSGLSVVILPVSGVIISGLLDQQDFSTLLNREVLSTPAVMSALLLWPMTLITAIVAMKRVKSMNLREQRAYYRRGNVSELTPEQTMALRLTIVDGFNDGAWTETLEYWPSEIRVPKQHQRFKFLVLSRKNEQRSMLDEWWGIVSAKQYHKMTDRLVKGMHSKIFVDEMQSNERDAMVERLAGLTQLSESYIEGCYEERGGKPKKLLWGFDLYRIISLARSAFMAGYIDEQQAWAEILKAADYIHCLFEDHDDFYHNYRLGNAFWSNNFETAKDKLERWQNFDTNCRWPLRRLGWPSDVLTDLPEQIKTGVFADENTTKVGFI